MCLIKQKKWNKLTIEYTVSKNVSLTVYMNYKYLLETYFFWIGWNGSLINYKVSCFSRLLKVIYKRFIYCQFYLSAASSFDGLYRCSG